MTLTDDTTPLPDDINDFPPAAYGAGAPVESYATYTKLRSGAFGIRVPGGATPGMLVDVRTKAGVIRAERVGHVLWSGNDKYTGKPMALCTVDGARAPAPQRQPTTASAPRANNQRQTIPTIAAPKAKRPGRQRMPRVEADDSRELSDAATARVARVDEERAAAEAVIGADEPLF